MNLAREVPTLAPPPNASTDLQAFPAEEMLPSQKLFRVSKERHNPWWFGNAFSGRFDLAHPQGTCYLAEDELGALLEAIGPERLSGIVSTRFLAIRRLYALRLPNGCTAADCTSRRAIGFGITGEIGTIVPYDLPQACAARLFEEGFEGIVYWLRHDPQRSRAVALFGSAGEEAGWPIEESHVILPRLAERLQDECGISVLDVPSLGELDMLG